LPATVADRVGYIRAGRVPTKIHQVVVIDDVIPMQAVQARGAWPDEALQNKMMHAAAFVADVDGRIVAATTPPPLRQPTLEDTTPRLPIALIEPGRDMRTFR
jgi:hypothetical protein